MSHLRLFFGKILFEFLLQLGKEILLFFGLLFLDALDLLRHFVFLSPCVTTGVRRRRHCRRCGMFVTK